MKTEAMVLREHGGPEVLQRETIDLPEPGPREVRVRVRAVAMNHLDIWGRRGLAHVKLEYPHRLGADVAGEIDALGPGARLPAGMKVGDRLLVSPGVSCGVCDQCLAGRDNLCRQYKILGESTQGGYGRHVNIPDANVLPFPDNLSFVEAAAVPLVFLTAWQMVVKKARLLPGQTLLVQAAGSGVSSAAIQIARHVGLRVIATASTDEKCERAKKLGAHETINSTNEDFVAACKKLTDKRGVDGAIEHVGGDVFVRTVLATAWGGRVVTCGATAGFTPTLDLRQIFFRQVEVLGSTMGSKGDLFDALKLVRAGALSPVVDRSISLWNAADGHRALEERKAFGKIVLEVD